MTNKVLITGANKGIGFETARQLGELGWYVLLGARNQVRGEEAVSKLKSEGIQGVEWINIDLNNEDTITEAAEYVSKAHPDLKAVINNAGIPGDMQKRPLDFTVEELRELTEVNFLGNFAMIKAFTPILERNNGRILNLTITSTGMGAFRPFGYMMSKAPLNAMIKVIGNDFKSNHVPVQIYGVIPGGVTTDLNGNQDGWMMRSVEDGGQTVVNALLNKRNLQGKTLVRLGVGKQLLKLGKQIIGRK